MKKNIVHIVFAAGAPAGICFPAWPSPSSFGDDSAAADHVLRRRKAVRAASGEPGRLRLCGPAGAAAAHAAREAVAFLVENLAGYLAAGRFLREEHVAAVVGLGGYASVPMARAASRRGVPLVLLEQNAVAGRATRWLARRATLICTAFAETAGRPSRAIAPSA